MSKYAVVSAEYVGGFCLRITFADGRCNVVDFEPFFMKHPHAPFRKYYNVDMFRQFRIEDSNVVWGRDWDLIIDPANLYHNNLTRQYA